MVENEVGNMIIDTFEEPLDDVVNIDLSLGHGPGVFLLGSCQEFSPAD